MRNGKEEEKNYLSVGGASAFTGIFLICKD